MKVLASGALVALFLGLFVGSSLRPAIAYAAPTMGPELVAGVEAHVQSPWPPEAGVAVD